MLDKSFTLKIADFGFAGSTSGHDGSGKHSTIKGTLSFMAPEIHLGMNYSGQQVDMFAAGVILFFLVAGHQPFYTAEFTDPYYKALMVNKSAQFWEQHLRDKPS